MPRRTRTDDYPTSPWESLPGCPICGADVMTFNRAASATTCNCLDCGASLTVPDEAWQRWDARLHVTVTLKSDRRQPFSYF
jgi:hypothetical protein